MLQGEEQPQPRRGTALRHEEGQLATPARAEVLGEIGQRVQSFFPGNGVAALRAALRPIRVVEAEDRRLGKEVYMFTYNGEPHGLRRRANQKDYSVRLQQFFDHYLKGAPEPEWMTKGIPYLERDQEKEKLKAESGVY